MCGTGMHSCICRTCTCTEPQVDKALKITALQDPGVLSCGVQPQGDGLHLMEVVTALMPAETQMLAPVFIAADDPHAEPQTCSCLRHCAAQDELDRQGSLPAKMQNPVFSRKSCEHITLRLSSAWQVSGRIIFSHLAAAGIPGLIP